MKKVLSLIIVLLISITLKAQQNYFIYIQADNKQTFYIKMKDKIMSSSSAGYLVIPKLSTGVYSIIVGFPKDQWVKQTFSISVDNKDEGFILKNFNEKGWGLYNMQSMAILMNGSAVSSIVKQTQSNQDIFETTLSGAANTSLSVTKDIVQLNEKKANVVTNEINKQQEKSTIVTIQKIQTFNDEDGKTIVYTDNSNNKIDTIRVFIPVYKSIQLSSQVPIVKNEPSSKPEPVNEKKFLEIKMQNQSNKPIEKIEDPKIDSKVPAPLTKIEKPQLTFNSDCKANAADEDFFKTRKKIVAEDTDDDMVEAARKQFKQKCYTVEQVKNLAPLFLTDAGKYKFFDAAYPYTSDTQNFSSLESLLKDEYFIKRFKSMIRN